MGGLWPATSGGRIRSLLTLSHLSARHQVTVVTTHGPDDDPTGLARRLPDCRRVVSLPFAAPKSGSAAFVRALAGSWLSRYPVDLWKWRLPAMREQVRSLARRGAVRHLRGRLSGRRREPSTGQSSPGRLVRAQRGIPDLAAARDTRAACGARTLLEIEWRKLRRCEAAVCAAADLTITVSEEDRRTLTDVARNARIRSVPTGVDTTYFAPGGRREVPHRLVFTGSMDWYPNQDAVLYFSDAILPRIRAQIPEVSFTVVGRNPRPAPRLTRAAGCDRDRHMDQMFARTSTKRRSMSCRCVPVAARD